MLAARDRLTPWAPSPLSLFFLNPSSAEGKALTRATGPGAGGPLAEACALKAWNVCVLMPFFNVLSCFGVFVLFLTEAKFAYGEMHLVVQNSVTAGKHRYHVNQDTNPSAAPGSSFAYPPKDTVLLMPVTSCSVASSRISSKRNHTTFVLLCIVFT